MIVNSAKTYRQWIKNERVRSDIDENFIGCSIRKNGKMKKGFFELFHGMKDDIERYLPSLLDIAEDISSHSMPSANNLSNNSVTCLGVSFMRQYSL